MTDKSQHCPECERLRREMRRIARRALNTTPDETGDYAAGCVEVGRHIMAILGEGDE